MPSMSFQLWQNRNVNTLGHPHNPIDSLTAIISILRTQWQLRHLLATCEVTKLVLFISRY